MRDLQATITKQIRAVGRRYVRLDKAHKEGKHVQEAVNCAACQSERRKRKEYSSNAQ